MVIEKNNGINMKFNRPFIIVWIRKGLYHNDTVIVLTVGNMDCSITTSRPSCNIVRRITEGTISHVPVWTTFYAPVQNVWLLLLPDNRLLLLSGARTPQDSCENIDPEYGTQYHLLHAERCTVYLLVTWSLINTLIVWYM